MVWKPPLQFVLSPMLYFYLDHNEINITVSKISEPRINSLCFLWMELLSLRLSSFSIQLTEIFIFLFFCWQHESMAAVVNTSSCNPHPRDIVILILLWTGKIKPLREISVKCLVFLSPFKQIIYVHCTLHILYTNGR